MSIHLLDEIYTQRPVNARLLGVDFGLRRIGLAVSNPKQDMASPAGTIRRRNFSLDVQELSEIASDYDVKGIIFGWPLHMDGREGAMCDRVRSFIDEICKMPVMKEYVQWIAVFDERLSTQTVDEFLVKSVDMSRTKRKHVKDKLAAQHILQSALDRIAVLTRQKIS